MFENDTATPPHCRDRDETGVIRPSAHVHVVGLQSRNDLNGCSAVVVGDYAVQRGRWPVRFGSGEQVMVKPSNILVDATQPDDLPSVPTGLAEKDATVGLCPGDSVELVALLSRPELNGTHAVCRSLDTDTGRWEVVSSTATGEENILKVKPGNLKTVTSPRCAAMRALSAFLCKRYPQRGFKLHPNVAFHVDADGGVCVRAVANIDTGDILLVLPEEIGICTRGTACSTELTLPNGISMQRVFAEVARLWKSREQDWRGLIVLQDAQLAVLLMHVACHPVAKLHALVAAAWPSMDDARASLPLFWGTDRLAKIRGTQTARMIETLQDEVSRIFEKVVEPLFSASSKISGSETKRYFQKEGASLKDCFFFGLALAHSRAHDSDTSDNSVGVLRPLVDAINGLPGPHPSINVEVHKGKWPFLRGRVFRDDCNLKCSAVAALRPIHAGEELIIDYGSSSTSMFIQRFGVVPRQLLSQENLNDEVECVMPPELKPPPSDAPRLRAIRDIFEFDGFDTGHGCTLSMQDLACARRGEEREKLK